MALGLVAIIVALVLASLAASVTLWLTEYDYVFSLVPTFRVDVERSVPTYFSAGILAMASFLLAMVARAQARRWGIALAVARTCLRLCRHVD